MPRAKTSRKADQKDIESNNDVNTKEKVKDKPKARVKKSKDDGMPTTSLKEPEEVLLNSRGARKVNENAENPTKAAQAPKPAIKGKKKASNAENGHSNKKSKEKATQDKPVAIDNIVEAPTVTVEEPPADRPVKAKTGRGVKQSKNLLKGDEQEEASSTVKKAAAPTKGRKKKEVDTALTNGSATIAVEKTPQPKQNEIAVKPKVATKRGRTKKAEDVTIEPKAVSEESPKKKAKIVPSEPVKINKRNKKNDKPNENETPQKTVADKKSKAGTSKEAAAKKLVGRKRVAAKIDTNAASDDDDDIDETEDPKPSKTKKALLNPTETTYSKADFELSISAADGNISNVSSNGGEYQRTILKISSWNVAGLRSWVKKDGLKYLDYEEPDIFCIQEIKCTIDQLPEEAARIPGYHPYWLCLPGGYAGVALYSKIMPINVEYGIGNEEFDNAGRLITAEYEKFFLVNVYVPNSGRKLVNLEARMRWEKLFQAHVKKLDARKPVVITGDMNVSHQEIDLANPKSNTRSAGFTIEEREKMTELLALGFVDTYRHLYPDKRGAYTYWTYMSNARARNVGWRLDYFLVSERILKRVIENAIRSQCLGSDHCPITLFINI